MFTSKPSKQCDGAAAYQPKKKGVEDLEVQLVLAFALGLFALLTFCVRLPLSDLLLCVVLTSTSDFTTTMAITIRCPKAPSRTRR